MNIFVSTSCIKETNIKDAILKLVQNGITNIELSGGTHYYSDITQDLIELRDKYSLTYRCHNYFPPPENSFVLNLASDNEEIYNKSYRHVLEALDVSKIIDSKIYSFHAGFYTNIETYEIGRNIPKRHLQDKNIAINRFVQTYNKIKEYANSKDLSIYVENNVLSKSNYKSFNKNNAFMLTTQEDYIELKKKIDMKILLDVAHLFVSLNVLNKDFDSQFNNLYNETDYFHFSNNDGFSDQNKSFDENSRLFSIFKNYSFKNKTITLEIYDEINEIIKSMEIIEKYIN